MGYVFWEIVMWLVIGVLLGVILGWLLCRYFSKSQHDDGMASTNDGRLARLQAEHDKAVADLKACGDTVASAQRDLSGAQGEAAQLRTQLDDREQQIASLLETTAAHEAEIAELDRRAHDADTSSGGDDIDATDAAVPDTSDDGADGSGDDASDAREQASADGPSASAGDATSETADEAASQAADDDDAPESAGEGDRSDDPDASDRQPSPPPPPAAAAPNSSAESAAASGDPDDLTRIKGIGKVLSGKLHALGVTKFMQIAAFTPDDVVRIDDQLNFKGRIEREDWIGQAKKIVGE